MRLLTNGRRCGTLQKRSFFLQCAHVPKWSGTKSGTDWAHMYKTNDLAVLPTLFLTVPPRPHEFNKHFHNYVGGRLWNTLLCCADEKNVRSVHTHRRGGSSSNIGSCKGLYEDHGRAHVTFQGTIHTYIIWRFRRHNSCGDRLCKTSSNVFCVTSCVVELVLPLASPSQPSVTVNHASYTPHAVPPARYVAFVCLTLV